LIAEPWRVEVHSYADRPRKVLVWKRGHENQWYFQNSLIIDEDVDAEILKNEVISRLPR
jgi:hypothetical protein